jgi:hypothetical protein
MAVYRYEQIQYELEQICEALETAKIPFIPLKGSVIRQYYPEAWMRTSCDIDILVKEVDRAAAVLAENGYINKGKGSHDIIFVSPGGVTIELHFLLIETDSKVDAILQWVWDYAQPKMPGSCHYIMQDEMFYFYHIAHMAKHVENGGCGVRPFLDMHILEQQPHNRDAREQLLRQGGLAPFETVCRELMVCWFAGREPSGLARQLQTYILTGGVYGSYEQQTAARQGRAGGKGRYTLTRIFPSLQALHHDFPVLQRHPWLLPGCWLWRLVRLPFGGRWWRTATELQTDRSAAEDVAVLLDSLGL